MFAAVPKQAVIFPSFQYPMKFSQEGPFFVLKCSEDSHEGLLKITIANITKFPLKTISEFIANWEFPITHSNFVGRAPCRVIIKFLKMKAKFDVHQGKLFSDQLKGFCMEITFGFGQAFEPSRDSLHVSENVLMNDYQL